MPLKIIKASDPVRVERIVLTIYAPPGVGKTSLAFSSEGPLLLDADKGAYRSAFRRDSVSPESWDDIAGITAADAKPYRTLVLDTTGRALDLLAADIIAGNPKMGRGGALTLPGYGELKNRFTAYLKLVRSFGLDVVLIAHSDEKQQGDEIIERIDMQGGSKQEVYKVSDAMARLGIVQGKRVLTFSPTETTFGKDPAAIGRIPVPDLSEEPTFLAGVIQRIKDGLNAHSEEQTKAAEAARERAEDWAREIARCEDADGYTALVAFAQSPDEKRRLLEAAKTAGFEWDGKGKKFAEAAKAGAA